MRSFEVDGGALMHASRKKGRRKRAERCIEGGRDYPESEYH